MPKIIDESLIRVVTPFKGSFIVRDKEKQKFWKAQAGREPNVNILPVYVKPSQSKHKEK